MEKLHSYQGWGGRFNEWRDGVRDRYSNWRQDNPQTLTDCLKTQISDRFAGGTNADCSNAAKSNEDYSHIYRPKTRSELIRISAAVMGIEFSYAAETAFVSPTLLKIGVEHQRMTLVWALSPLIGFFVTPILGSVSDRCRLDLGRRRPFIILLSIGVLIGLILVPNGESLGYAFGDIGSEQINVTTGEYFKPNVVAHRSTASDSEVFIQNDTKSSHTWGIFFTILGTVLLDFDADACQSPSRAYLLDVTLPEDHARGLSTFTIMAGLGGFMGYSLGGINWDNTTIGILLGGHVRAVFTLVTFIFIFCVSVTVTSFSEVPLWLLESYHRKKSENILCHDPEEDGTNDNKTENCDGEGKILIKSASSYGTLQPDDSDKLQIPIVDNSKNRRYTLPPLPSNADYSTITGNNQEETSFNGDPQNITDNSHGIPVNKEETVATLSHYLMSIVLMPHSMRMVCLTNLFCWMAHVCYSLYFTDFVGEAVFGGDPKALSGSVEQSLYEQGVRFGCWGMAMYSLSCACYSSIIEKLIKRFGARKVYVGGLLFYCVGMSLMAMTRAKASVIIFSWAAGVMYSTLFTMPYLLIAHYHATGTFEINDDGEAKLGTELRGLGTDVAIVSSMVFLAQFILSICMGTIVTLSGTTTAVVTVASILSFCGAISATQIMYLDL